MTERASWSAKYLKPFSLLTNETPFPPPPSPPKKKGITDTKKPKTDFGQETS